MAGFVENNELVDSKHNSSLVKLDSGIHIIEDKILNIQSLNVAVDGKLNMTKINRINESIDRKNQMSDIRFRYLQNYLPEIHTFIDNDPNIKKLYDVWKSIDFKEGNIDSLQRHMNPAMFNKLKELLTVGVNHFDKIASQKFDLIQGGNKKFKKNGTNKLVKKSKKNRTIHNKLERKIKYKGGSSLEQLLKSDNSKNNYYTIIDTDNQPLFLKESPILIYFTFNFDRGTDNYNIINQINNNIEALKQFTESDLIKCAEEFVDIDNKEGLTKDKKKEEINKTLKKYKDQKEERAKDMNKFIEEEVKLSGEIYLFSYDKNTEKASNVRGPFAGKITCDLNNGNIKDFTSSELNLDVLNIILTEGYTKEEVEEVEEVEEEEEEEEEVEEEEIKIEEEEVKRAEERAVERLIKQKKDEYDSAMKFWKTEKDQKFFKESYDKFMNLEYNDKLKIVKDNEKHMIERLKKQEEIDAEKNKIFKLCAELEEKNGYVCNKQAFITEYGFDKVTNYKLSEDYNKKVKWVVNDNEIIFRNAKETSGIHQIFSNASYYYKNKLDSSKTRWYRIDSPMTSISLTDLRLSIIDGLKDDSINIIDAIASLYIQGNKVIHDKLNKIIEQIKNKHELNKNTLKILQEKLTQEIHNLKSLAQINKNMIISKLCFVSFCVFLFFVYIFRQQIWDMIVNASAIFSGIAIAKELVKSPGFLTKVGKIVAQGASAVGIPGAEYAKTAISVGSEVVSNGKNAIEQQSSNIMQLFIMFMSPVVVLFTYAMSDAFKELLWTIYSLFGKPLLDNSGMLNKNMNKLSELLKTNDRKQIEYVATHYVGDAVVTEAIDDVKKGGSGIYKKYTKTSKNAYKKKYNKTKKNKMLGGNNNKLINFIALELFKFSANFVGIALGIIDYKAENSLFYDKEYIPNALYNQFLTIRIPF
jgi:hypothetical protein